ncbi:hypothetical protein BKA82DRAFT_4052770 [Pisolithus tinctorius]|nr:hypothetical protein BKA82DRAFT_4052770 [Pisolithus tinctorius]
MVTLKQCSLPLTGARTVSQVITELAVCVDRDNDKPELTELLEGGNARRSKGEDRKADYNYSSL